MRISWVGSTVLLGIFLFWGIIASDPVLIRNSAIALGVVQVIEVTKIARQEYTLIVGLALGVHVLGSAPIDGRSLYAVLPYWDVFSHAAGVAALTVVAWVVLTDVVGKTDQVLYLSDRMVLIWAAILAIAVGAGWEIIEYAIQLQFDVPVLRVGSLEDHMQDLLSGVLGGLISGSWIALTRPEEEYFYIKPKKTLELTSD